MTEATSQYLNKPTLTERERALVDALKNSKAALRQARERLEMNNYGGEELPFIQDCEDAWNESRALLAELD
jgi:hypothetical protein